MQRSTLSEIEVDIAEIFFWMIDTVGLATAEVHRFNLTYITLTLSQCVCCATQGL